MLHLLIRTPEDKSILICLQSSLQSFALHGKYCAGFEEAFLLQGGSNFPWKRSTLDLALFSFAFLIFDCLKLMLQNNYTESIFIGGLKTSYC